VSEAPYKSSLIEALRGSGVPGATMGGDVQFLNFPWMQNTDVALRQRAAAPASFLSNPEILEFDENVVVDKLKKQREENALWDRQTGGPTGDRINPVALLIEQNKERVEPIETGNPVLNVVQTAPPDIQPKPAPFASVEPSELETKLMPDPSNETAEKIIEARAKGEPDPLTPDLQALVAEQAALLQEAGKTMADLEKEYPAASFGDPGPVYVPPAAPEPTPEPPKPALDPRDYRLQEKPAPMFAGLVPPAVQPEPVPQAPVQPAAEPIAEPVSEPATVLEAVMAAIAQAEAEPPAADPAPAEEQIALEDALAEILMLESLGVDMNFDPRGDL
jgi:hypothetical protein